MFCFHRQYHTIIYCPMLIIDVVVHRYRGTYKGHDVAIKCLRSKYLSNPSEVEFLQEVLILRQAFTVHNNWINQFHFVPTNSRYFLYRGVSHENILQFYEACTKHPNYCIVTGTIICLFFAIWMGLDYWLLTIAANSNNGDIILVYTCAMNKWWYHPATCMHTLEI
jgi:hypothetical protein